MIWWQIKPNQTAVIMHYNSFLGIDLIDFNFKENYYKIFTISVGSFFLWLVNSFLGLFLIYQGKNREKFVDNSFGRLERKMGGYLLLAGGIVAQLASLVYIWAIIKVNMYF